MVFSRAVQHGGGGVVKLFQRSGVKPNDTPRDKILKVYGLIKKNYKGFFKNSSTDVRNSVRSRMHDEPTELLRELEQERK